MIDRKINVLRENALQQLHLARKNFANILDLIKEDSAYLRLMRLFDQNESLREGIKPTPYEEFLPHAWLGFSADSGAEFIVAQDVSILSEHPDIRQLRITRSTNANCDWLTLELRLPWSAIREAGRATVSMFCEAGDESSVSFQMYCLDTSGAQHEMIKNRTETIFKKQLSTVRLDQDIQLPGVSIDFETEPHLAIFLEPSAAPFMFADIDIRFV
jgi:hypothetical protein